MPALYYTILWQIEFSLAYTIQQGQVIQNLKKHKSFAEMLPVSLRYHLVCKHAYSIIITIIIIIIIIIIAYRQCPHCMMTLGMTASLKPCVFAQIGGQDLISVPQNTIMYQDINSFLSLQIDQFEAFPTGKGNEAALVAVSKSYYYVKFGKGILAGEKRNQDIFMSNADSIENLSRLKSGTTTPNQ
ncbi:hypothetical protein FRACYDRAFT_233457 [Fragilariopsis cylindrus CCMP1102]|uniref:Uncharacterized protein n=1 Tax=Fragilariopsis cylindrus CCMP1102 TaxID=635003 RepID=A0A1E7FYT6_9STRA|nr:hypothetical protein FRACYDRAFT_233457 [Fragilariopsis cylindrus CCMP1102]|eukprot:OEU23284.1 hypothetical protein FRACYDRAFT_233457 [Fragilariopsis cylindrus CCMP1102]